MIPFFIHLSLRNLFWKNRLHTLINITGLAVGMACVMLVAVFIYDEYHFDTYHTKYDRIFRVVLDFSSDGQVTNWAKTSAPIGQYLAGAYPEIEQVVRLRKNPGTDLLRYQEVQFYEERLFFADSSLFHVFDFPLVRGEARQALTKKNSIVISEPLAARYFNAEAPIGKTLLFNNQMELTVTGIMQPVPENSHFIADAFITFSSLEEWLGEQRLAHWGQFDHYTYVLLTSAAHSGKVEALLPDVLKKHAPAWVQEKEKLYLQPLTSIHLHSDRKDEITPNSRESYSYILGTIAVFILLMAFANFINLTTATQIARTREIAIQKIMGATGGHLVRYFLLECLVISMVAWAVAYAFAHLTLPYFNQTTGKHITLSHAWLTMASFFTAVVIGTFACIFPSLQAFRFGAHHIYKLSGTGGSRSGIRTALITFQFSISIFLVVVTLIVSAQFRFLKSFRLGFESDQVIVIPIKDRSQNSRHATLVNEIGNLPGIAGASFSASTPGSNNSLTYTYSFTGTGIEDRSMATLLIDENFLDLYQINLKEGRNLRLTEADTLTDVLLNDAAVQQLGLVHPIGQRITGKVKGIVVGITENFNHTTLHRGVEPVIMYGFIPTFRFVSVKLKGGEIQEGLDALEKRWSEWYPGYPMEFAFMDEQIQQLYKAEWQLARAYRSFSLVAIVIAGIGLIGLATYQMTRRQKEISIRKVLGSSTGRLIMHIYSDYVKIILIALPLACAGSYYWMNEWLGNFAYAVRWNPVHFILAAVVMLVLLFSATGIQTIRAANANPADNLREE